MVVESSKTYAGTHTSRTCVVRTGSTTRWESCRHSAYVPTETRAPHVVYLPRTMKYVTGTGRSSPHRLATDNLWFPFTAPTVGVDHKFRFRWRIGETDPPSVVCRRRRSCTVPYRRYHTVTIQSGRYWPGQAGSSANAWWASYSHGSTGTEETLT